MTLKTPFHIAIARGLLQHLVSRGAQVAFEMLKNIDFSQGGEIKSLRAPDEIFIPKTSECFWPRQPIEHQRPFTKRQKKRRKK